jgi:hypothetical protein
MGRQSLVQYIDAKWKGTPADVDREYQRNKAIALKYNCWKGTADGFIITSPTRFSFPPRQDPHRFALACRWRARQ